MQARRFTKESLMLLIAGCSTWVLVAWLGSQSLPAPHIIIASIGYSAFLLLFLLVASHQLAKYKPEFLPTVVMAQAVIGLILSFYTPEMLKALQMGLI